MNQKQRNEISLMTNVELEASVNRYERKLETCQLRAVRRSIEKRYQALIDEMQIRMIELDDEESDGYAESSIYGESANI